MRAFYACFMKFYLALNSYYYRKLRNILQRKIRRIITITLLSEKLISGALDLSRAGRLSFDERPRKMLGIIYNKQPEQ